VPGASASADHEGCFCQCTSTTPLLTPPARAALIAQSEELRAFALKEEAEDLCLAEGAFPALSSSGSSGGGAAVGVVGEREEGREVVVDSVIVCF